MLDHPDEFSWATEDSAILGESGKRLEVNLRRIRSRGDIKYSSMIRSLQTQRDMASRDDQRIQVNTPYGEFYVTASEITYVLILLGEGGGLNQVDIATMEIGTQANRAQIARLALD